MPNALDIRPHTLAPIVIDPIVSEDGRDVYRIAKDEGLPAGWTWPEGLPGTAARVGGRVVAFCILKETIYGIVIEELWREHTREGVRGIYALGDWIETTVQQLATERGKPLACGGAIRLEKDRHIGALKKRDFYVVAEILEKVYLPQ